MNPPRRILTPGASNFNKRKEREFFEYDAFKPSPPKTPKPASIKPGFRPLPPKKALEPACSNNLLLAGYLAHEFLTKGTLFGEKWDPARAEAVPVSAAEEWKRVKSGEKTKAELGSKAEPEAEKYQMYVEIASLIKTDGAHIPGIVNPTQLARFLHM